MVSWSPGRCSEGVPLDSDKVSTTAVLYLLGPDVSRGSSVKTVSGAYTEPTVKKESPRRLSGLTSCVPGGPLADC